MNDLTDRFISLINRALDIFVIVFECLTGRNRYPIEGETLRYFSPERVKANAERVKQRRVKNVAFFCMSVPLWKYETIFEVLSQNDSFNPLFFISPRKSLWADRKKVIQDIKEYCKARDIKYIPMRNSLFFVGQNLKKYDIDIAFYSQPYQGNICREYDYVRLKDSLLCYVPYGFIWHRESFCYASILNKIAWRQFFPSDCCYDDLNELGIDSSNVVISGYPGYDMYLRSELFKWPLDDRKRIIWAPHFSVSAKGWLHLSSFLGICDYIRDLVKKYQSDIQIAFKPHPHLYASLIVAWGKEKTDDYFNWWKSQPNTVLCTSENYPLFKSSDAMIHDSGSFVVEYMYTQKPCMFLYLNEMDTIRPNKAGIAARNAHYPAYQKEDIEKFIVDVVINNRDSKIIDRREVLERYIVPTSDKTSTDIIVEQLTMI